MTDNRTTELLDGLRNVGNLHEFAELFGFDWHDDSDWTWHDVAVKMADDFEQAIAATLGNRPTKSGRGYYTDRDGEGTHIMCDDCGGYIGTAEEIAATLGSGTCEMVTSGTACKGNTDKRCTACGAYGIGEHYDGDEHIATPKFCPECGKKVER